MNTHAKILALLAFLLPLYNVGRSKESRIEQLRKESLAKAKELKVIGDQIVSCYAFFDSCGSQYHDVIERIIQRQLVDSQDDEEKNKQLKQELEAVCIALCDNLEKALKGEVSLEYDLNEEFFRDEHDGKNVISFDKVKFFFVRAVTDSYLLIHLVEEYQACFHELIEINKELALLEDRE